LERSLYLEGEIMKIDRKNPMPIYHQIYRDLKERIEGDLISGEYLPSEDELADQYGVSRLTVRQALKNLMEDGIIEKQRGKKSKIKEIKNIENLSQLKGFTQDAILLGHTPSSVVLANKLINVPDQAFDKFKVPRGSKVIFLNRLRLLDGIPYAIEMAYINVSIDVKLLDILDMDMSKSSLYAFFKDEVGLKLEYADETIEVVQANSENTKLLGIQSGNCILLRNRFTYTHDGQCIEYVQSYYRGDKYKFNIRIRS
jgi:GntR family transcriptional regulator